MSLPISEADIQEYTGGGSFERGQQYLADGAVRSLERTGKNRLKARVQGSDVHPYLVSIQFDADRITRAECSCPYHGGTWCKHIVAVLLRSLQDDTIPRAEPAAVNDLVEDLNRADLIGLLERLAEQNPNLLEQIESEVARFSSVSDK